MEIEGNKRKEIESVLRKNDAKLCLTRENNLLNTAKDILLIHVVQIVQKKNRMLLPMPHSTDLELSTAFKLEREYMITNTKTQFKNKTTSYTTNSQTSLLSSS